MTSEAEEAQRNVAESMPAMHSEVGQALALLTDTVVVLVAVTERQAAAQERLADRLDSWTHEPRTGEFGVEPDEGGPELRVRRW